MRRVYFETDRNFDLVAVRRKRRDKALKQFVKMFERDFAGNGD